MAETQRVAIVTGAAGGIGRAMTRALLAAGIRVAGVDRDREPLAALAASAREQGNAAELLTIATDLTDDSAADAITKATRGKFGRIDILVNNAGIGPGSIRPDSWQRPLKFWEITPDQWRLFVAVHTTAPLALTNAVVPEMMRQDWGRIVNVTTSLGTMLNAGSPTYGPSKAALEALSAIMAHHADRGRSGSQRTPRWRETDSNLRSPVRRIYANTRDCRRSRAPGAQIAGKMAKMPIGTVGWSAPLLTRCGRSAKIGRVLRSPWCSAASPCALPKAPRSTFGSNQRI
jgi:NAD(P)-dependent dehydrogenase (short-subunit alcohol dehydrogenase family)